MENGILLGLKQIKEISKKKKKLTKIELFAKKSNIKITTDGIMVTMINSGVMQRHDEKESITYNFFEQSENNVVTATDTLLPANERGANFASGR